MGRHYIKETMVFGIRGKESTRIDKGEHEGVKFEYDLLGSNAM
jgi:hypothetical protein